MEFETFRIDRVLHLRGNAGVGQGAELQRQLLAMFDQEGEVGVDLSEVSSLDLAAIQLLCSARYKADRIGRRFYNSGSVPAPIQERFRLAGVSPFETACPHPVLA